MPAALNEGAEAVAPAEDGEAAAAGQGGGSLRLRARPGARDLTFLLIHPSMEPTAGNLRFPREGPSGAWTGARFAGGGAGAAMFLEQTAMHNEM